MSDAASIVHTLFTIWCVISGWMVGDKLYKRAKERRKK